ncbi:MAG: UDP-N-acetylmuramate dehydrogenase [Anaerolineales bacterium]|nr:UDP-N-acetylmuramate dehydrogenase [Anaerolineales bacterium]
MTEATFSFDVLRERFGGALKENAPLAPFTSARIGGAADFLLTVKSADELAEAMQIIWEQRLPHYVLGSGSNVLVGDEGFRGVVVLNRAKEVRFEEGDAPAVWCESGVVIANLAKRCAAKNLGGLEWSGAVPGTVGGAVFGNAGAFGGETAQSLAWAEILTPDGREKFTSEQMKYGYRSSVLKSGELQGVVLSALLKLKNESKEEASAKIGQFSARRKATQPPGASMGSMFKNPPGDYAGRLIEAAGLKGTRVGGAAISEVHANFFVNQGETQAQDVRALIRLAQETVLEKFGVTLELEIELVEV